jgi:hypothetical protein
MSNPTVFPLVHSGNSESFIKSYGQSAYISASASTDLHPLTHQTWCFHASARLRSSDLLHWISLSSDFTQPAMLLHLPPHSAFFGRNSFSLSFACATLVHLIGISHASRQNINAHDQSQKISVRLWCAIHLEIQDKRYLPKCKCSSAPSDGSRTPSWVEVTGTLQHSSWRTVCSCLVYHHLRLTCWMFLTGSLLVVGS